MAVGSDGPYAATFAAVKYLRRVLNDHADGEFCKQTADITNTEITIIRKDDELKCEVYSRNLCRCQITLINFDGEKICCRHIITTKKLHTSG